MHTSETDGEGEDGAEVLETVPPVLLVLGADVPTVFDAVIAVERNPSEEFPTYPKACPVELNKNLSPKQIISGSAYLLVEQPKSVINGFLSTSLYN